MKQNGAIIYTLYLHFFRQR